MTTYKTKTHYVNTKWFNSNCRREVLYTLKRIYEQSYPGEKTFQCSPISTISQRQMTGGPT